MKTRYYLTLANRSDREIEIPRWLAFWLSYRLKSAEYVSVTIRVDGVPGCSSLEDGEIRNVSMNAWDFLKVL